MKGIIKFGFQKIIDHTTLSAWDTCVFEDTWMEYKMQAANYNQPNKTTLFSTIIKENTAAEKLHYAVSTAAIGYIRQLQGMIPGLQDVHGKCIIPFRNFKFNIIQSDTVNNKLHKVEIIFISEPLTLLDVFNGLYLIALGDQQQRLKEGEEIETTLIPQVGQLAVFSFINPRPDL
jgi:hypothetical protein